MSWDGEGDNVESNSEQAGNEPKVHVWEIADFRSPTAFRQYREYMAEGLLPSSVEYRSDEPFEARFEATAVQDGLIARFRCSPHVSTRTRLHSSNHGVDGFHVVHLLSGAVGLEISGKVEFARQGDTVVFDGRLPSKCTTTGLLPEVIGICVPRSTLETEVLKQAMPLEVFKCRTPLANCLELMAQRIGCAPLREFEALYEASVALASIEMLRDVSELQSTRSCILREILQLIDRDLGDSGLSPQSIANRLSISVRYVHKLFATKGTTCAAYILTRRLDQVRHDLIANPREPIATLAIRWGFNEVGHFNRVFKRRFGYTPSSVRRG